MATEIEKVITELDEQIAASKNRLKNILSALNWTEKDTLGDVNSSRKLRNQRSKDEPALPESFGCANSIVIGENQLKQIVKSDKATIPKKFSDIQLNYSREQKTELYDYVISNTGKISEPELKVSVPGENQTDTDMTFAEIVAKAKKKDKTLQRKYRTSKPTHIEEVRNVVHLQMTALKQYFNPFKEDVRIGERNRRQSQTNDRRRLSNPFKSRSRSGDRKYHKESMRSRSRDRDRLPEGRRNKSGDRSQFRGEINRSSDRRNGSRERSGQSRISRNLDTKNSFRDERRKRSHSRERVAPCGDRSIERNVFKNKAQIYRYPESRNEDRRHITNDNRYGKRDEINRSKELKNKEYQSKEHLSRGKVVERRKSLSEHKSEHTRNLQSRGRSGERVQNTSMGEKRTSDGSKPSPSKYKAYRNEDKTLCNTKRSETPDNIKGNRLDKKKKHGTSKKNLCNEKSYRKKDSKKRNKEEKRHKSGDRSESGYRNRYRANRSSTSDSSSSSRSSASPKNKKKR